MSVEYVPIIGDMMISRWAYEALAVNQFKNNEFQKYFFDVEKEISHVSFQSMFRIPELQSRIDRSMRNLNTDSTSILVDDLLVLKNEFSALNSLVKEVPFDRVNDLVPGKFNEEVSKLATQHLEKLNAMYRSRLYKANEKKDMIFNKLAKKLGSGDAVAKLKEDYYNKRLADFALNKNEVKKIIETKNRNLFQTKDPIYNKPVTNYGRAHFYAAEKIIFGQSIDTVIFDIIVIWLSILLMYIMLLFNGFKKLIDFLSDFGLGSLFKKRIA